MKAIYADVLQERPLNSLSKRRLHEFNTAGLPGLRSATREEISDKTVETYLKSRENGVFPTEHALSFRKPPDASERHGRKVDNEPK